MNKTERGKGMSSPPKLVIGYVLMKLKLKKNAPWSICFLKRTVNIYLYHRSG